MKKIIMLFCVLIPTLSIAQYTHYIDSNYQQPYTLLDASTSINNGQFWDDPTFSMPIGFDFHLFNDTSNKLFFSEQVGLGGILSLDTVIPATTHVSGIVAIGSDIQDRDSSELGSFSPISYKLTGTAPNRIFKLEWRNAGFYNAIDNGNYDDSLNLQLWLYEGIDAIEMRFGQGNYISPNTYLYDDGPGPWIGLFDSLDLNFNAKQFYYLKDTVTAPTIDSFTSLFSLPVTPGMKGNPISGSVYRFIPKKGGSSTVGFESLYNIISHDMTYLSASNEIQVDVYAEDKFQYILRNMQGQIISANKVTKGRNRIDTQSLPSGMYLLQLYSPKENVSYKFIK